MHYVKYGAGLDKAIKAKGKNQNEQGNEVNWQDCITPVPCLKQITNQFSDSQTSIQDNYMISYKTEGSHKGKTYKLLKKKKTTDFSC